MTGGGPDAAAGNDRIAFGVGVSLATAQSEPIMSSPTPSAVPARPDGAAPTMEVLKVSATSKPVAVAGAIAGVVRTQSRVEVQAIGAGAINQAIKAIAISRGYVAPGGLDLVCIPSFIDISIDGEERTGIRLVVEVR